MLDIAEYEGDKLLRRYIPGHSVDQRVAMIELDSDGSTELSTHFYHANRLGSVQATVNASTGAVTDRYVYSPFGVQNLVADDQDVNRPSSKPFRYTERKFDAECVILKIPEIL